jgi:hypothetical protein
MVLGRVASGWIAATVSARQRAGGPPLPAARPGTPCGPAHTRSGPSGLSGTHRYAGPRHRRLLQHLAREALRIRRSVIPRGPGSKSRHVADNWRTESSAETRRVPRFRFVYMDVERSACGHGQ